MLFVTGGILEMYRQGRRRISAGDFFAASGDFFWRFVRLTVLSFVPFGLIGAAYLEVETAADYLGDKAVADQVGFVALAGGRYRSFPVNAVCAAMVRSRQGAHRRQQ